MHDERYDYFNIHQATNPEDLVILTPRGARHFAESAMNGRKDVITDDQQESKATDQDPQGEECLG